MTTCGAKTRAGHPCRAAAGQGTNHVGEGRCRLHGGATPVRHGRYSKINRTRLASLIADYEADPDPLCVLPEIAAARALFVDFVERYDLWRESLLAWHGSFSEGENPRPREVLDVSDAYRLLAAVARIAQQEKRLQLDGAISRRDLHRVLDEMVRVVGAHVEDPELKNRIVDGFGRITLA